ncbi:Panacea domain-containing protein [Rhodopseudomonas sp. BAL398]|nr:Panacea domain-containing protein [Rhodopseudomonas sp. BAL398]WOK19945.1 Panacea domain-containing protein [Rhodopseudomonas sp. BAL398]
MLIVKLASTFLFSRFVTLPLVGRAFVPRFDGNVSEMAKYRPKTPEWFDTRKAAQAVAFFALKLGTKINILKATKLVYLADRLSIERRDHAITNDSYVSMPFGPVNTNTYDYMNGKGSIRQNEWSSFISNRAGYDLPLAKGVTLGSLDELSRSDLKILEDTWEQFKDIDKYELAEWTHRFCPEWQNPGESSIPIEFSTIFRKLKKSDPGEMAEEIAAERKLRLDLLAG